MGTVVFGYDEEKMHDFGAGLVPAHRHLNKNGILGGWVAETASVDEFSFIGPEASVYEEAVVTAAIVDGTAEVFGGAHLDRDSTVMNDARVYDQAYLGPDTLVRDFGQVFGSAKLGPGAIVKDAARVHDDATVGDAIVKGLSDVSGHRRIAAGQVVDEFGPHALDVVTEAFDRFTRPEALEHLTPEQRQFREALQALLAEKTPALRRTLGAEAVEMPLGVETPAPGLARGMSR